jgi:hypothetical protein
MWKPRLLIAAWLQLFERNAKEDFIKVVVQKVLYL